MANGDGGKLADVLKSMGKYAEKEKTSFSTTITLEEISASSISSAYIGTTSIGSISTSKMKPEPGIIFTPSAVPTTKIMHLSVDFVEQYTGMKLDLSGFKVVYDYLRFVGRKEPVIHLEQPSWLAGGSIVRYLIGKQQWQSDFDFWMMKDMGSFKALRKELEDFKDKEAAVVHSDSYLYPIGLRKVKVQLIHKEPANLIDLFEGFDFTVCQFAYNGGDEIYCTEKAFADLLNRRLSLNKVNLANPEYTKARIFKYMGLGFVPDETTLKFLADPKTGEVLPNIKVLY